MTPHRTWDPIRFQRGTRGFAAFVTALNGFIVLGFGAAVVPVSDLPEPARSWMAILAIAAGIAHLVAVIGLVRGRRWARTTVTYLAAAGIGASAFGLLLVWRAGETIVGAGDASTIGFFVWMIGAWLVAARFTLKAYGDPRRRANVAQLPTPRVVSPTAGRASVRPARQGLAAA